MIGIVSLWTPFLNPQFMIRWFSFPYVLYVSVVPIATLALFGSILFGLKNRRDARPFLSALGLFLVCYVGLGISLYPMIIPPSISIWDAAAPENSLKFLLVGALILIPIILIYTAYSYWVFRGKIGVNEGYH